MKLVTQKEARALFGGGGRMLDLLVERLAERRAVASPLALNRGLKPGAELQRWLELHGLFELEIADPAEAELRAPTARTMVDLLDPSDPGWVAEVVGLFTASTVVMQQEAMSFLASWVGTKDGSSRVFYFHPGDWGVWPTDGAIVARLFRVVQEEDRPEFAQLRFEGQEEARLTSGLKLYESITDGQRLPDKSDPGRLFARVEWLVQALTGLGQAPAEALTRAAPVARFLEESDLIPRLPHVALYWLWSHFLLGNAHELEVTLSLTEGVEDAFVVEARSWMRAWLSGRPQSLGPLEAEHFERVRRDISEEAPVELFGADRRRTVLTHRERALSQREEEALVRAPLEEAAAREPEVGRALQLMDHLSRGGAVPPRPFEGMGAQEAMEAMAAAVDVRFAGLLELRLARASLHGDGHEEAGWGLLLALASVAPDLDGFEAALRRCGTERFGPRRRAELYRAYARFPDARATEVLTEAAERWLMQVDDWIRSEPSEAVQMLLQRDALQTHRFIARLLERASFTFANVDVCVEAARTAGRLRSQRSIAGLERAVRERLGRVADGGRTDVAVALAQVQGEAGAPFFRELVAGLRARWESSEEEDEAWETQVELACALAGALPCAPGDPELSALVRSLAETVEGRLGRKRPPPPETLEMATSLVLAAQGAQDPALARRMSLWSEGFRRTRSNAKAAGRLDAARMKLAEDLL
ncbi:MAG: hypothetical protein AAF627_08695 [Myxococcota bacterium]